MNTPSYDAIARTFNAQLPPHHDEQHPALFAAAWTKSAPQISDVHLAPTVPPPPPSAVRAAWDSVRERPGRLAFARSSRACHGVVRNYV